MEITASSDAGSLNEYVPDGHLCAGRGNEDLCPEDELALSAVGSKRNRKDGRLNLRKSLAWNPAFFNEKGVLEPSELSMITGSVNKASSKLPIKSNVERPLKMQFDKFCKRPPLNNLEQNLSGKVHARPVARSSYKNDAELLPISEIPSHGGPQMSMTLRKTLSMKHISKNVPKSDAAYIRLRKEKTAKLHIEKERSILKLNSCPSSSTSSQMKMTFPSSNVMVSSFPRQEYNFHGLPSSPMQAKQSALNVPSAHGRLKKENTGKPLIEKDSGLLELNSRLSSTNKSQMETTCSDSDKIVSLNPQPTPTVCRLPAAPTHAKPSSLRMPSPSLGFFERKKDTSSCSSKFLKTSQAHISNIPSLSRPTNLKHMTSSKPPVAQTEKQPNEEFAACTGNMKQVKHIDIKDNIYSMVCGSTNCLSDVAKEIKTSCLSAHHKMDDKTPEILLGKAYTGVTNSLTEGNCSKSQSQIKSLTGGSEGIGQVLIPKGSEDGCISHQYSVSSIASEICSTLSEMHCPEELAQVNSKPPYACTINMINDLVMQKGTEDKLDENGAHASKDKHSSMSPGLVSNLRPPSICTAFVATKEICFNNVPKEELTEDGGSDNSVEIFHGMRPQVQESSLGKTVTREVTVSSSENVQIVASEEQKTRDDFQLYELRNEKNEASFLKEKGLVPPKISLDNMKQDAALFKHQLDAVPYSEEWLAAIEAYGEDILEVKSGTVHNSPPDKALPEPGPWSPVKRKDQDVGPFDCTKYTTKSVPSMELY